MYLGMFNIYPVQLEVRWSWGGKGGGGGGGWGGEGVYLKKMAGYVIFFMSTAHSGFGPATAPLTKSAIPVVNYAAQGSYVSARDFFELESCPQKNYTM